LLLHEIRKNSEIDNNSNIAYYYSYDLNNRLTGVTSYNLAKIFNVDYQYDITVNRTMMTFKEGTSLPQVIKYSYNQNNQMTKIETDRYFSVRSGRQPYRDYQSQYRLILQRTQCIFGQNSLDTQDDVSYASYQEKKSLIISKNLFYLFDGELYL
jgi:hypothetical protein